MTEHESIPSHPLESGETSSIRSRSTPLQTVIPPTILNDGQTVECGEGSSRTGNPGPQPQNQEWVLESVPILLALSVSGLREFFANASMYLTTRGLKSGLMQALDKLSDLHKDVLQGYGLGNDTGGDPAERFQQQLQKIRNLGDRCSNEPKEVENGRPFLTRGRVYNILRKIERFANIGDIAIQHHPDVVALVWASLRMLLQVCDLMYTFLIQVAKGR